MNFNHVHPPTLVPIPGRPDRYARCPRRGRGQTGKSTLTQAALPGLRAITLDDDTPRRAALAGPAGFLSGLAAPTVRDEVQRVLPHFPALKASVDRNRRPGQFVLTGAANPLLLPKLSKTMTGRIEILTLWPLSQAEIQGTSTSGLQTAETSRPELLPRVLAGGCAEARARPARWLRCLRDQRRGGQLHAEGVKQLDHGVVPRLGSR